MATRSGIGSAGAVVVQAGMLVLGGHSGMAAAAEYCVVCDAPAASYRCVVEGAQAPGRALNDRISCIKDIARAGGHESCAVANTPVTSCSGAEWRMTREDTLLPGVEPLPPAPAPASIPSIVPELSDAQSAPGRLSAPSGRTAVQPGAQARREPASTGDVYRPPRVSPADAATASSRGADDASTSEAKRQTGPETSEAPARSEAQERGGNLLQQSGRAVGEAAKKTWHCITSLFGDC